MLLMQPSNLILCQSLAVLFFQKKKQKKHLNSHYLTSLSKMMSSSVIIWEEGAHAECARFPCQ